MRFLLILAFCLHLMPARTSAAPVPAAAAACDMACCCGPTSCGCFEAPDAPPASDPLPPADGRTRGLDLLAAVPSPTVVALLPPPPAFEASASASAAPSISTTDRLAILCIRTT